MKRAYCATCKKFYPDDQGAFGQCPKVRDLNNWIEKESTWGHGLLHEHECSLCGLKLYFQTDDDYCGPSNPIICGNCVEKDKKS